MNANQHNEKSEGLEWAQAPLFEPRVLQYLVYVADLGTVSAVAETLHVAQPSISRQLRALERRLGVDLFIKQGRKLRFTPSGREFVGIAREMLRVHNRAEAAARQLSTGVASRLLVAASLQTINEIIAPALSRTLTAESPHVDYVPTRSDLAPDRLAIDADLAIGSPPNLPNYVSEEIGKIPLFAQFQPRDALSNVEFLHIHDLADEHLILLSKEHSIRPRIDAAFLEAKVPYTSFVECRVPKGAQALAATGKGIALLTNFPDFNLQSLPIHDDNGPLEVEIHATWYQDHYADEEVQQIVRAVRRYYAERLKRVSSFESQR